MVTGQTLLKLLARMSNSDLQKPIYFQDNQSGIIRPMIAATYNENYISGTVKNLILVSGVVL